MGAAAVDIALILRQAAARLRARAAPERAPAEEGWKKTSTPRLLLWIGAWGTALVLVASGLMQVPLHWVLLAVAFSFPMMLVNGISLGITDSNPISSAFVLTIVVFAGARLDPAEQDRIVARCWDLPAIDTRYRDYIERYGPMLNEVHRGLRHGLPAERGFVWRFWATYDYLQFPRVDPFLPDELLPRHWRGGAAWQLLAELRTLLHEHAQQFLEETRERVAKPRPRRRVSSPPQVALDSTPTIPERSC